MNETIEKIIQRKSIRAYEPRPIDPDLKNILIESAFQAPTAGNQMLYTILDITDQDLKEDLAELCDHQPFIATAPLVLIFLADGHRWLELYQAAGCTPRKPGAGDALLSMADAVIAAQNVVVAAESLGLGSCYIGDILENCEQIRARLNLPADVFPAAMLVIGWPTQQQRDRRKPVRFAREYMVAENAYPVQTAEALRIMYLERAAKEGRDGLNFETQVRAFCERKYESDFAREMNRSAEEYLKVFLQEKH